MSQTLKLQPIAIGSLPHKDLADAMKLVEKDFFQIPFFPQLSNIDRKEDMMYQFLEGMPSFSVNNYDSFVLNSESEEFFAGLEEFFTDYEEIISDINSPLLEKYAISEEFSSSYPLYEKIIKKLNPEFAKGQIIGAFTLATSLKDQNGNYAIYDETLKEVIVKLLSLKVLWQIKRIKKANTDTIPIIFMDEPSVSQIGTSAYLTVSEEDVISMVSEISELIKNNGGISAIHCCGKCDWRIPIRAGVDIINFDAYSFSKNFNIYHKEINQFLNKGGKIAWGLVPTLDGNIFATLTVENLVQKYKESVKYLTENGINEKLITDNSLITSSCGAGSLSVKDAQIAMDMVKELSDRLKEEF